ncbi:MAG: hypothetical protein EXX96DRAFT_492230, partial [Benjaminiella poitrasii]
GYCFDLLFNSKQGYKTKRSECHSQTIKSLKKMGLLGEDEKDVRLDFVFTNSTGIQDVFFCEDKPKAKESAKDKNKSSCLRERTLRYWSKLLPYEECSEHLCALSCHFSQLNMKIMGSKLVDGMIIHACLKEVAIPADGNNGAGLAEYLITVISLVRMVTWNFNIIQLIIKIFQQDNAQFLSELAPSSSFYREDSPASESTSSQASSSSPKIEWEEDERKMRILEKIE